MIYFRKDKIKEAKEVLENFFKNISEEEIYTTYYDINDLYLEIIKILAIQLIFKGKVLPDQLKLNKLGFNPERDVLTIMILLFSKIPQTFRPFN